MKNLRKIIIFFTKTVFSTTLFSWNGPIRPEMDDFHELDNSEEKIIFEKKIVNYNHTAVLQNCKKISKLSNSSGNVISLEPIENCKSLIKTMHVLIRIKF